MPVLVPTIVVSRHQFESPTRYTLLEANCTYVEVLIERGLFRAEEILPDAVSLFHLWNYIGGVNRSGHETFAWNSRWDTMLNAHVRAILPKMGASDNAHTFSDFCTFVDSEPEVISYLRAERNFDEMQECFRLYSELAKRADETFFRLRDLYEVAGDFLRAHPAIEVTDVDRDPRIAEICASNPHKALREAEKLHGVAIH